MSTAGGWTQPWRAPVVRVRETEIVCLNLPHIFVLTNNRNLAVNKVNRVTKRQWLTNGFWSEFELNVSQPTPRIPQQEPHLHCQFPPMSYAQVPLPPDSPLVAKLHYISILSIHIIQTLI